MHGIAALAAQYSFGGSDTNVIIPDIQDSVQTLDSPIFNKQ